MRKIILIIFSCFIYVIGFCQHKIYYVSPSGNDINHGLDPANPWRSLLKVTAFDFEPGDKILLEGGGTFQGTLELQSNDRGSVTEPIIIDTYGTGKAIIDANNFGRGIYVYNTGGIEIRNLIIKNNGATNNTDNGVEFFIDQQHEDLEYVKISNIDVHGFGGRGILIWTGDTEKGYKNVSIKYCTAYNNGMGGIETLGNWHRGGGWSSLFNHKNIYVGYCKAFFNDGVSTYTANHSGNGILISGVDSALIEYCEAYENGSKNGMTTAGPVGIWLAEAKNGIIQYCESHHNKSGAGPDGGGFDIDGGAQNCIIQYSYSHDNAGGGFALFEWGSGNPFFNNILRYNISQNDGRKNNYAGLMLWGPIKDCQVYNNTVYIDDAGANGTPSAIKIIGGGMQNVQIQNNILYVVNSAKILTSTDALNSQSVLFQNNNYFSASANPIFSWGGISYNSFDSWRSATTQERNGTSLLGTTDDPLFINPGGGKTIHPADGGNLEFLTAYRVQLNSSVVDAGMNLKKLGLDVGDQDFYKHSLLEVANFDIGANEFNESFFKVLPLKYLSFNINPKADVLLIETTIANESKAEKLSIELSLDGKKFITQATYAINDAASIITFNGQVQYNNSIAQYCRLKAVDQHGRAYYTRTVKIQPESISQKSKIYPNPTRDRLQVQLDNKATFTNLLIRSLTGSILSKSSIKEGNKLISLDISLFEPGIYFIEMSNKSGAIETLQFVKL